VRGAVRIYIEPHREFDDPAPDLGPVVEIRESTPRSLPRYPVVVQVRVSDLLTKARMF
jgi:hypothetical protein